MHPNLATLIAFCDGEAGSGRSRTAKHLARCDKCRGETLRIRREKEKLAASHAMPQIAGPPTGSPMRFRSSGSPGPPNLAEVLPAIARWRRNSTGAAELRRRLRSQIETYFGSSTLSVVERSGMPAEELLGRTREMLDVFLGQAAAEAVTDDVLSGLESAGAEEWR